MALGAEAETEKKKIKRISPPVLQKILQFKKWFAVLVLRHHRGRHQVHHSRLPRDALGVAQEGLVRCQVVPEVVRRLGKEKERGQKRERQRGGGDLPARPSSRTP